MNSSYNNSFKIEYANNSKFTQILIHNAKQY